MVDIEKLYDNVVAAGFERDSFGILAGYRKLVSAQLDRHARDVKDVLDLAVGAGTYLRELGRKYPGCAFTGLDISDKMLEQAARNVKPLRALKADSQDVAGHVPPASVDLALMHGLLSYVDHGRILVGTAAVMRKDGFLSIVSGTYEGSFPAIRAAGERLLGREALQASSRAPESHERLIAKVEAAGFRVLEAERLPTEVRIESVEHLYDFGMNEGWFAHIFQSLDEKHRQGLFDQARPFFPLADRADLSVLLARKKT
jgi:SAM-dependent methyltransferase